MIRFPIRFGLGVHCVNSRGFPIGVIVAIASRSFASPNNVTQTAPVKSAIRVSASHMYNHMVREGNIEQDPMQIRLLRRLDKLQHLVETYLAPQQVYPYDSNTGVLKDSPVPLDGNQAVTSSSQLLHRRPRGLYIVGSVGTGKTMAMDLFFSSCAVDRKRRVHFHKFLLEVHARVHAFKKDLLQRYGRDVHVNLSKERDPWTQIAKQIANESRLLCFDEFQVTDIADAVIMTKLFGVLWSEGVVLVATSNRTPGELYENGLNREYFLPFISMLEEQCVVFDMKSTTDYRKRAVKKEGAYFCPLNPEATQQMRLLFTNYDYAHPDGAEVEITEASKTVASNPTGSLEIRRVEIMNNRYIDVEAVGRSCWVSFRELCFTDRGAADYAALCRLFDCIFIDGIAKLNVQERDVARRFVTLIDEVYDAGTRIVWTGAAPPLELFEDLFRKTSHVRVDVSADDLTPFDPAGDLRREQSSPIERTLHHGAVTPPGYQDRFRLNEAKYSSKDPTGQSIEEEASNSTDDVVHISKGESAAYTDLNLALQRAASRLIEMSGVAYQPARR